MISKETIMFNCYAWKNFTSTSKIFVFLVDPVLLHPAEFFGGVWKMLGDEPYP